MIKRLLTTTAVFLVLAGTALAQSAPAAGTSTNGDGAAAPTATAPSADNAGAVDVSSLKPSNMTSMKADDLKGADVLDPTGKKIADINDIVLAPDGKVDAVIVDFGGFLGIGTKQIALAFEGLRFMDDNNAKHYLVVNATKDQLNNQRAYNKDDYAANRDAERLSVGDATATASASAPAAAAVSDPAEFANKAGTSNMFEIEASKVALSKSQNPDIKAFAQKMIDDHTKAGQEMSAAATGQQVTPPTKMDPTNQAMLDKLNGLSASDFDSEYSSAQVKAHTDAVALFQAYADNGQPGALKDFAAKTLPTLQMHMQMAQKLPKQTSSK